MSRENSLHLAMDVLDSRQRQVWYSNLRNSLKSKETSQRILAAVILGIDGGVIDQREAWLSELLEDSSEEVQITAIESLGKLGSLSEKCVLVLSQKLTVDSRPVVRTAIVRALGSLGASAAPAMPILSQLIADDDVDESIRIGAVSILGRLGEAAFDSLSRAALLDTCVEVRQIAVQAIKEIAGQIDNPINVVASIKKVLRNLLKSESDTWIIDQIANISDILRTQSDEGSRPRKSIAPVDDVTYDGTFTTGGRGGRGVSAGERDGPAMVRGERLQNLLNQDPPPTFAKAYEAANELLILAKQEVAGRLEAQFNAKIREMPQDSYADKKTIASWVNSHLRALGLAIRCPKTGMPAILIADIRGQGDGTSRFRLEITEDDGRKVRTLSTSNLNELDIELRDDDPRKEGPAIRRARGAN